MKIGIFSDVTVYNPPFPSGVSRFFREITTELVKRGHEIIIFEPLVYPNQPKIETIKDNIIAYRPFSLSWTKYLNLPIIIPLKEVFFGQPFKLDIVHANAPGCGILAAVTSWKQQIPRLISYHTPLIHYTNYIPFPLFFLKIKRVMNYLERKAYSLFDMIIVPTHGVKNALNQRGFKGHFGFFPTCLNLQNLPNPSTQELEAFQQKFDLSNKKLILFVGRMSPEKGVNQILRLVPSIVKEEPNAHFLMVGTGPFLEKYKKISQQCNLTRYITFTGYLSDFDLFSAISISNLGLIFANDAQIFDMTILEYWHYGLPLVIRKAMGIDEVVTDGKNGLLFSSLDEGKKNILTLLKDEDLSVKIKRNCKSNVDKNYDIKKCIPKLENLYGWCSNLYYHT